MEATATSERGSNRKSAATTVWKKLFKKEKRTGDADHKQNSLQQQSTNGDNDTTHSKKGRQRKTLLFF
jgi:hypothetical protein